MTAAAPAPDEVRVWRVDVPLDPAALGPLAAALTDAERAWAARLREGGPRARFVAARAALRRLLAVRLGCGAAEVPLVTAAGGKPELADGAGAALRFSVSHAGALALVAIAARRVGVDVEGPRAIRDPVALAARFFSASERALVEHAPEAERGRRFLELWTAKEAILKATGAGLSGLPDVEVSLPPDGAAFGIARGRERWAVATLRPAADHVAAVAAERLPPRLDVLHFG